MRRHAAPLTCKNAPIAGRVLAFRYLPRQRVEVAQCPARRASIPHMLERLGNVLYWVCAIAAVGLTAIMLASVLTHGADITGIGISILIGVLIWFIGWAVRIVVSG
jgi:hypothetical protein